MKHTHLGLDDFFQDYESKLEALQKQVDSRYLESPEEEEEPEEEGDTDTNVLSLRHAFVWPRCAYTTSLLPRSAVDGA